MNVIVLALDTLRADHLSCYGYARETSPTLDALAGEGILFENALTNTAHTGPTFTTIYTGQYPFTHGIVSTLHAHPNEPDQLLDDEAPTLPEVLRRHGYLTAAFDNLMIWGSHPSHFARGYDYYVHTLSPSAEFCAAVLAEHVNARLIPWIESVAGQHQPFFLFVHYWDPHQPYNQPEPYRTCHAASPSHDPITTPDGRTYTPRWGWEERLTERSRERIDLYDGEITYVDEQVRRVLETLKGARIYDETAVFVTADHGEDMEEHNAPFEHREPYETTVHVPLIVKPSADWPAAAPPRVKSQVGHIDLMPSILDLLGVEAPDGMDGRSWRSLLEQPGQTFHDVLYLTGGAFKQNGRWRAPELAVRTDTAKYIRRVRASFEPTHTGRDIGALCAPPWRGDKSRTLADRIDYFNSLPDEELYDLEHDLCETHNIAEERPEQTRQLREALDRYVATNPMRA